MLNWVTQKTSHKFNGKFYEQVDGVAMNSPLGPLMADIFMNWLLDEALKHDAQPKFIC